MTTIDLGGGRSAQRHHFPKDMLRQFDEASATFSQAQANIRALGEDAESDAGAGQLQRRLDLHRCRAIWPNYSLTKVGGALLVDQRDTKTFTALGFVEVSQQQPNNPRVGLVFLDAATGQYLRWNGSAWAPVTLE